MSISVSDHHQQELSLVIDIPRPYREGMTPQIRTTHLESLAWTIDRVGIDEVPTQELRELRRAARAAGCAAGVADLLCDRSAPAVVRHRAFGHVAAFFARLVRHEGDDAATAAGCTTAAA
jgi:hypothetical protein